ncbi:MAG: head-tail adaptor protein [Rhodobacteraceae bacterium]|nr:head-tail adaptor protein [Paracoccaceae bacterium]
MSNRRRFAFDAPQDVESAGGGVTKGWPEQFECWAHLEIAGGGEGVADGGIVSNLAARIALRVAPETRSIKTTWRARDVSNGAPGEVWNVLAVEPPAPGASYIWFRIGKGKAAP